MDYSHSKVGVLCSYCGASFEALLYNLVSGHTKSCGCLQDITRSKTGKKFGPLSGRYNRTHGMRNTVTYSSWLSMRRRCYNLDNDNYSYYGGRGITVCDRWLNSFENFLVDMGVRPSKLYTLDRKDPNRNYEPSNCRWVTWHEQRINRRGRTYAA